MSAATQAAVQLLVNGIPASDVAHLMMVVTHEEAGIELPE